MTIHKERQPIMDASAKTNDYLAEQLNNDMRRAVMPVTVFVGIEVVIAFFGNLLVLYVFLFRYGHSNFRYFVLCLAFTDITSAVTTMPGEIVTQLYWYVYPVRMVCKIKSFFNMFTVSSEALCLLTIAVDRYRKVCHPFGWQIKEHVAKWLCVGIYCVGFVVSLPVAIFWGTHNEIEKGNITTTVCEKDQKFKNTDKPTRYSITIESILGVCLACMFLLYVLIARQVILHDRRQSKHEMPERKRNENNRVDTCAEITSGSTIQDTDTRDSAASVNSETEMTIKHSAGRRRSGGIQRNTDNPADRRDFYTKVKRKTLIMFVLTITFIVTTILYLTLLSFIAHGILPSLTDTQRAVYFFFFRLYFINHVINPIVYGVLDPQFRAARKSCRHRRPTGWFLV